MPLRDHALLVVKWLAMDGVRLVGAHPPEIKDRYVDIKPQDWTNMFKLVNEADSKKWQNVQSWPPPNTPSCN